MPIDGNAAAPYGPPLSIVIALGGYRFSEKVTVI
jgi:hypothetical protein